MAPPSRRPPSGVPTGLDRGLSGAVGQFASAVGSALSEAATGTSVAREQLDRDAVVEAFNLSVALIDADGRHTDDELWALVAAFAQHELLPAAAMPADLRRGSLIEGKRGWLDRPSELFATLVEVDRRDPGRRLSRRYYEAAMTLAHTVASLDRVPSESELEAIVAYQRRLLAALPTNSSATRGKTAPHGSVASESAAEGSETPEPAPEPEPLDEVLVELDELIGLGAVKEEVHLLSALLRVQKLRADRGLPTVDSTKHLVFSGNPGTGKTTVARLLARIYLSLGVVERGHLTEVDRGGLVAGFVGQTATKVADVFEEADGGVLLIDEAYSLIRGGEKDFGREAIDAIVKQVEDRRDSLVVILAGYPKEMAELIAANPGFSSRFPKTITFPDYTDDELVQILELMVAAGGYEIDDAGREAASAWFGAHERGPGFGNGRLARNLFEAAVARHARRLVDVAEPTDAQLTALVAADIAGAPIGGRS